MWSLIVGWLEDTEPLIDNDSLELFLLFELVTLDFCLQLISSNKVAFSNSPMTMVLGPTKG
jgi:hypothetical protein